MQELKERRAAYRAKLVALEHEVRESSLSIPEQRDILLQKAHFLFVKIFYASLVYMVVEVV